MRISPCDSHSLSQNISTYHENQFVRLHVAVLPCEGDEYKEDDGEGPPLTVSPDILMVLHHLPSTVTTATSTAAEAEADQGEDEEEQKTDNDTGSIPPKLLQVLQQKPKGINLKYMYCT